MIRNWFCRCSGTDIYSTLIDVHSCKYTPPKSRKPCSHSSRAADNTAWCWNMCSTRPQEFCKIFSEIRKILSYLTASSNSTRQPCAFLLSQMQLPVFTVFVTVTGRDSPRTKQFEDSQLEVTFVVLCCGQGLANKAARRLATKRTTRLCVTLHIFHLLPNESVSVHGRVVVVYASVGTIKEGYLEIISSRALMHSSCVYRKALNGNADSRTMRFISSHGTAAQILALSVSYHVLAYTFSLVHLSCEKLSGKFACLNVSPIFDLGIHVSQQL